MTHNKKLLESLEDLSARMQGIREYLKSNDDCDLVLMMIKAEERILDIRSILVLGKVL